MRAGELLGRKLLPGRDAGAPACTARSQAVLYRIDERALEEVLAADSELATGLSAIAATRQAALAETTGTLAPGHRATDTSARFVPRIRRLFGQR